MKKFLRKFRRKDNFKLDAHREVVIDGNEMIIVGFSSDGNYTDLNRLSVDFVPKNHFLSRR